MTIRECEIEMQEYRDAPLAGIRVIAVERFGAGPFCSLYLADAGADVIKIEDRNRGGDVGRYVPPVTKGDSSLYFKTFNRGKRSISLDLKNQAGRDVFHRLVGMRALLAELDFEEEHIHQLEDAGAFWEINHATGLPKGET